MSKNVGLQVINGQFTQQKLFPFTVLQKNISSPVIFSSDSGLTGNIPTCLMFGAEQ